MAWHARDPFVKHRVPKPYKSAKRRLGRGNTAGHATAPARESSTAATVQHYESPSVSNTHITTSLTLVYRKGLESSRNQVEIRHKKRKREHKQVARGAVTTVALFFRRARGGGRGRGRGEGLSGIPAVELSSGHHQTSQRAVRRFESSPLKDTYSIRIYTRYILLPSSGAESASAREKAKYPMKLVGDLRGGVLNLMCDELSKEGRNRGGDGMKLFETTAPPTKQGG